MATIDVINKLVDNPFMPQEKKDELLTRLNQSHKAQTELRSSISENSSIFADTVYISGFSN